MTKSELIERLLAGNTLLRYSDVERAVNAIFNGISVALDNGDRVELRGFGSFSTVTQSARTGRNPTTGEAVTIPERLRPNFKTGKLLRDRLNGRA